MTHMIKNIAEIIEVEPLISIMRNFYDFSRIPQGIFDKNHKIICEFGTQRICDVFHRTNTHTGNFCIQKNEPPKLDPDGGEFSARQCANGLMTYTVPVIVNGELIAVAYLGQFFTEQPDMSFFSRQAQRYGFEEAAYLQAISEVPVVAIGIAQRAARFLSGFSKVLSTSAANMLKGFESEERARCKEERRATLMESLLKISKIEAFDQNEAIEAITELTAKALAVDYVSFCRRSACSKDDLYTYRYINPENYHEQFVSKDEISQHPAYFKALDDGLIIVAHDAIADSRTREYNKNHHIPLSIASTIEVPTRLMGETTGVLSIEHAWEKRDWSQDELYFALLAERMLSRVLDWFEKQRLQKERRILEENLLQSRKMDALGVLAGGIAHDFNNILGVILGYAELAIKTLPDEQMVNEYLQEICKSSVSAKKTIEKMLAFSRKGESMSIAVSIDKAFNEILRYLGNTLPEKITMNFSSNAKGIRVYIDPYQLHQITLNLIKNAIYSMRGKGGCMKIVLGKMVVDAGSRRADSGVVPGSYLHFTVADEGEGISAEVLPRIFEPYFTTKPPSEGTGMGLAMVHGIVKSAGGFIETISEVGKGTLVSILLPIFEDMGNDETAVSVNTGLESKIPVFEGYVVCIDDEKKMARLAARMLKLMGFECDVFNDPLEMLDALAGMERKIDMAVIDSRMPAMNGLELAGRIKYLYPAIETILMTTAGEKIEPGELAAQGISIILEKPLRFADMVQAIGLLQKESNGA